MSKYQATFQPKCFDAEDSAYSGTVTMRLPNWDEKNDVLEVLGGEDAKDRLKDQTGMRNATRALAKFIPTFLISAAIVRKDDGTPISTWEDVQHEADLAKNIIPELAWWPLMGKHRISDPSKPS